MNLQPSEFYSDGFSLSKNHGGWQVSYQKLEIARKMTQISVVEICTALGFTEVTEYEKLINGNKALSTYQKIMIFIAFGHYPRACQYIASGKDYNFLIENSQPQ